MQAIRWGIADGRLLILIPCPDIEYVCEGCIGMEEVKGVRCSVLPDCTAGVWVKALPMVKRMRKPTCIQPPTRLGGPLLCTRDG